MTRMRTAKSNACSYSGQLQITFCRKTAALEFVNWIPTGTQRIGLQPGCLGGERSIK